MTTVESNRSRKVCWVGHRLTEVMRESSPFHRGPSQGYSLILELRPHLQSKSWRSGLLVRVEPLPQLVCEEEPQWQNGLQRDSSSHQKMEDVLFLCVCLGPGKTVATDNE